MADELLKFFVLFFVIVEPISLVPLFAAMTDGADESFRRRMALRAVLIAGTVFALFAIGGAWFLETMGISVAAFRIAGGIMLFLIALEMVFARESGTRTTIPPPSNVAEALNTAAMSRTVALLPKAKLPDSAR